ncbi:hypothetical protein NEUTE2DRAFT_63362 [Neurospora tetrasperma FGSC 2509]|nr:hypothetical protein NEUTE2DRAFT_63362 [Neurospora tetrasperma FGSC 2509]
MEASTAEHPCLRSKQREAARDSENVNTEKFPWHGKTAKSPKVSIVFVEAELVPDQLAILPFPLEDGPFQTITCMSYSRQRRPSVDSNTSY